VESALVAFVLREFLFSALGARTAALFDPKRPADRRSEKPGV
jgi:hypothetical protein